VAILRHLTRLDPDYPSRLRDSPYAPASLSTRGGSLEADVVVAIVGSRRAKPGAVRFTRRLSATLARAGAVVVSGGARGIDAAAHEGALEAGGRTWVVAATGHAQCFPAEHARLFEAVEQGPGAMLWPFDAPHPPPPRSPGSKRARSFRSAFPARNRILVTLADAVIVVQAGAASGALNAASWAIRLERPLWVAPSAPWTKGFAGSRQLLRQGARLLPPRRRLLRALGLAPPPATPPPALPSGGGGAPPRHETGGLGPASVSAGAAGELVAAHPGEVAFSFAESMVMAALSASPLHLDAISVKSHLSAQETGAALLTLALENVVVEGPPGFFRRRNNL
jgi:DNA processing protein